MHTVTYLVENGGVRPNAIVPVNRVAKVGIELCVSYFQSVIMYVPGKG